MGGIGIIAVAIAILPALRIGGMQLFRTESSDRSEKVLPRAQQIAVAIAVVYVSLTVACALAYWLVGMSTFDAAAHAMTTIATSGFSTSDASLGKWNDAAVHWIAIAFMIAGSLPFVLYVRALRPGRTGPWLDSQARTFLAFLATATLLMSLWLAGPVGYAPGDAVLHAAFSIVSVVTTTGFATEDYSSWGNAAVGVFFGLMFVGGCTGSTAGGIKIFRYEVVAVMLRSHFLHLLYPRGVFPRVYAGRLLPDDIVGSVVVFFALFFASYGALTIGLMTFGLDFLTSASGAVSALANIGPGLGDIIGPSGNFSSLPDGAKWLLAFGMLLGRLELFTIVILFMPHFWRG
jgi:trk system potassium uptake protein TrkH